MEKNRTNIFSIYLIITFLLILTFITMVISESYIIRVPIQCPPGKVRVGNRCRVVF
nr:U17_MYRTX_Ta1f [Tetramorium africanum]